MQSKEEQEDDYILLYHKKRNKVIDWQHKISKPTKAIGSLCCIYFSNEKNRSNKQNKNEAKNPHRFLCSNLMKQQPSSNYIRLLTGDLLIVNSVLVSLKYFFLPLTITLHQTFKRAISVLHHFTTKISAK